MFVRKIVFKWRLSKLHKNRKLAYKKINANLAKARVENLNSDELKMMRASGDDEEQLIQQEIDCLISRYWIAQAEQICLPTPPRTQEGMWDYCHFFGQWALTNKGVSKVRKLVREEKNARFVIWEKIFTAIWTIVSAYLGYLLGKSN